MVYIYIVNYTWKYDDVIDMSWARARKVAKQPRTASAPAIRCDPPRSWRHAAPGTAPVGGNKNGGFPWGKPWGNQRKTIGKPWENHRKMVVFNGELMIFMVISMDWHKGTDNQIYWFKPHDLNGKIDGLRLRSSLKPIHWFRKRGLYINMNKSSWYIYI